MAWDLNDQKIISRYQHILVGVLITIILVDIGIIVYRKNDRAEYSVECQQMNFIFRFDPNSAEIDELEAVPGLNRKLAQAIVDYRQEYQQHYPDRTAFMQAADLKQVKGISEKTIIHAEEFLIFPQKTTSFPLPTKTAFD